MHGALGLHTVQIIVGLALAAGGGALASLDRLPEPKRWGVQHACAAPVPHGDGRYRDGEVLSIAGVSLVCDGLSGGGEKPGERQQRQSWLDRALFPAMD